MKKTAAFAFLVAQVAWGQAAPMHVFASNGVRAAFNALKAQCETAAGRPMVVEFGTSVSLKRKIEAGEAFDLAIMTPDATADLVKSGKIAGGTAVDLARSGIGFGVREGAPKPNVATAEAVKQTLLKAKSISVVKEGASKPAIDKMFAKLGVWDAIASKTTLEGGTEQAGHSVATGKSELEIVPLSEIPLVKGVQIVGPLPGDFQTILRFQASVGANAKDPASVKKVITLLTSPAAASTFKANGMETN